MSGDESTQVNDVSAFRTPTTAVSFANLDTLRQQNDSSRWGVAFRSRGSLATYRRTDKHRRHLDTHQEKQSSSKEQISTDLCSD